MKKSFLILLILTLFTVGVFADNTAGLESEKDTNIFKGTVSKINFDVKTAYQDDEAGVMISTEIGIKARQTLADNFLADAYIRFIKPMSNENGNVEVEILKARFQYINTFFHISLGRAELTKTLSTLNYFGPYITAGQRYLDTINITIPLYLKAGIPEIEEISLPPIAFSFYYFPTMLSLAYTSYDGLQEFYMGQLRINTSIADNPTQIIINTGVSSAAYFNYSMLSGNLALDTSVSIDLFEHIKINASYGILNTELIVRTSAMSAGIELHDFNQWLFVIDTLIFEMQFPFGNVPGEFEPTQNALFALIKNTINNFRYGAAVTTASNDFTFRNIESNNPEDTQKFGSGNIYAPEGLAFNNEAGNYLSFYVYAGYEF